MRDSGLSLILFFAAFTAAAQPTIQSVQADLDRLQKPGQSRAETGGREGTKAFTPRWSMISGLMPYTCNGDLCYEDAYGLAGTNKKDTLYPEFRSIELFHGRIFLSGDRWAALVTEDLKVTHAFARAQIISQYFIAASNGKRYAVLDSLGRETIPAAYDSVIVIDPFGMDEDTTPDFLVKSSGKWGVIDSRNQFKTKPEYEELIQLRGAHGFAGKKGTGKYAFVLRDSLPTTPFVYDTIYSDYAPANFMIVKDGKIGLMNSYGKVQAKPAFDYVTEISTYGCRCVKMNGKFAVFSSGGVNLSGFVYEAYERYNQVYDAMQFKKNGKWGFFGCISKKEITPFIYDRVVVFRGNEADMMLNGVQKKVQLKDE